MDTGRRQFIAAVGASVTGAATMSGCTSHANPDAKSAHYGMVIDLRKCIGCKTCAVACKAENHTPPGVNYMVVMEKEIGSYPNVRRQFIPRPCMQCQDPSCTKVCPTQATYQRDDGVVVVDYDKCIGCRYCMEACPYGARSFDFGHTYNARCPGGAAAHAPTFASSEPTPYEASPSPEYGENRPRKAHTSPINNVRKCHFCLHRVKRGMLPACASACPGRAIYFGDLNDDNGIIFRTGKDGDVRFPRFPGRNVMQLKAEIGNDPSVYYLT